MHLSTICFFTTYYLCDIDPYRLPVINESQHVCISLLMDIQIAPVFLFGWVLLLLLLLLQTLSGNTSTVSNIVSEGLRTPPNVKNHCQSDGRKENCHNVAAIFLHQSTPKCYLYHTQSSLIDASSFKSKISCSKGPYLIETLKTTLIFCC